MDFSITMSGEGLPEMGFDKAGDIRNNAFLSLVIQRGAWWFDPAFGSRLHEIKKATSDAPALAEAYAKEALKWLLDVGRAKAIEVTASLLRGVTSSLRLNIVITRADGTPVNFEHFVEVV